jgi:hypothetical protein
MRPESPGSPPPDASKDEKLIVDGLERALAQARTKIPDHDEADVVLPSPARRGEPSDQDVVAPVPFDGSAVMEVLRGAIDRYARSDGHKHGTWVDELARAKDNSPAVGEVRPLSAGYTPDRRRLAAAVVVLFLLAGGIGYTQFGSGGTAKVNTQPIPTVGGQAVTLTLPTTTATTAPTTSEVPTTVAPPVTTAHSATTSTTARPKTTTTTAPPETTTTTAPPETTTTITTTTTTIATTTTVPVPN